MRKIFLAILLVFILVVAIFVRVPTKTVETSVPLDSQQYKTEVFELVNKERVKSGLYPLKRNEFLDKSAQLKADDMMLNGYWGHIAPNGTEPWIFFYEAGYDYRCAGENLGREILWEESENFSSNPGWLIDMWLDSPKHRENMLSQEFIDIGVGFSRGRMEGQETVVIVNHFGTLE